MDTSIQPTFRLSEKENTMPPHLLEQRCQTLLEAHASNLIEHMDMGKENLASLLELAKQNISNQEFERLAMA